MSQRVLLVQAGKTDWTSQLGMSPRAYKTHSSAAAVMQLLFERTLGPALTQ